MTKSNPTIYWAGVNGTTSFRLRWPAEMLGLKTADMKELFNPTGGHVVVHNPVHVPVYIRLAELKLSGVRITIGIDDNFQSIPFGSAAWTMYHPQNQNVTDWNVVGETCKLADRIVVSSEELYNVYGKGKDCVIIPNYLPDFYYDIHRNQDQWGVGWSGNIDGHKGDPEVTRGFLSDYDLRVVGKPPSISVEKYEQAFGSKITQAVEWQDHRNGDYQRAVASFKVGIVPLKDTAFNRSKSFLKGLEYAALGVPFVASPVGEYNTFSGGLRAKKPRHWKSLVGDLLADEALWKDEMVRNRELAEGYSLANHIDEWRQAWDVVGR